MTNHSVDRPPTQRRLGASTAALALLASCSVFMPSHSNSYQHEGESVEITMVKEAHTPEGFRPQFFEGKRATELVAAAGAALVGLAIDQIGDAIEEEADKLEAQHGQRVAVDNFWNLSHLQEVWTSPDGEENWVRDYLADPTGAIEEKPARRLPQIDPGISILSVLPQDLAADNTESREATSRFESMVKDGRMKLRGTSVTPSYTYSGFTYRRYLGKVIAFEMHCDFQRSTDGTVFLVVPKHITLTSAKAKVMKLSLCPLHAWSWFADVGNEVEVDVQIAMDAIWMDEKLRPQLQTIGAFDLKGVRFDLTAPSIWQGNEKQSRGWFPSVPRSYFAGETQPRGNGTFWLEVKVTERDPSGAKKRLEKAARTVRDKRQDLVDAVRELGDKDS